MRNSKKWILGATVTLAVAGLVYAVPAAMAAGSGRGLMGFQGMGNGMTSGNMAAMHSSMSGFMNGDMAAMHGLMAPLMDQMPVMHDQVMSDLGQLLGMTPDELTGAMAEGRSLAEIAQEQNVSAEEIGTVMTKGMESVLDRLVAEQSITQEQAAQVLSYMADHLDECIAGQGDMMSSGMMGSMMSGTMRNRY